MKKILFTLVALVASMSISAQVVRLYKNGNLVASFNKRQADKIVFEEAGAGAVDLGLSVKWATCNLGANNPEEAGKHYAWGETVPQANNVYSWSSYRWCQGTSKTMIKYCTDSSYGQVDNTTKLIPADDAAQVSLGEGWRIPTKAEMKELVDKCTWTWTSKNGTLGYEVTAGNGNSIFLPVTGTRYESSLNSADWLGSYWTNDLYERWNDYANYLTLSENNHGVATMFRCMGMAIRPVYVEHEYVDLGLSAKWATCNIGAGSPEGYGYYFAWGETSPQSDNRYSWDSYTLCNGSSHTMTKYCTSSEFGTVDNITTLEPADDAARANWGEDWRMPTKAEQDELLEKCKWTWTTQGGINGYNVEGPNGNSIFLPAAGYRMDGELYSVGEMGHYWSSSLGSNNSATASNLVLFSFLNINGGNDRYNGFPIRPVYNKHEYVDLGLSVKWATCNIGASSPEGYGYYFAWGETSPQSDNRYSWDSYTLCNGSSHTMTKYCTSSEFGTVDNITTLEPADDAARANWGEDWRMPTKAEQDELLEKCKWTWTTQGGINGYNVEGPNGNSIFLPAAGYRIDGELNSVGEMGHYWSSSLGSNNSATASNLVLFSFLNINGDNDRYNGFPIRPVCP